MGGRYGAPPQTLPGGQLSGATPPALAHVVLSVASLPQRMGVDMPSYGHTKATGHASRSPLRHVLPGVHGDKSKPKSEYQPLGMTFTSSALKLGHDSVGRHAVASCTKSAGLGSDGTVEHAVDHRDRNGFSGSSASCAHTLTSRSVVLNTYCGRVTAANTNWPLFETRTFSARARQHCGQQRGAAACEATTGRDAMNRMKQGGARAHSAAPSVPARGRLFARENDSVALMPVAS
jgi:hypothetical protein